MVLFDLTKTYDTAWKYVILKKLHDFGHKGNLPLFIQKFLSDRKITVKVRNTFSNTIPTLEGVPQGSVLSCTCFIALNPLFTWMIVPYMHLVSPPTPLKKNYKLISMDFMIGQTILGSSSRQVKLYHCTFVANATVLGWLQTST